MNRLGITPDAASLTDHDIFPTPMNFCPLPKGDVEEVECKISTARACPQLSLSGVVDAILEVGHRRKSLLDQLRSAFDSGNESQALGFARQLCGLSE
jgi:hypothetical protein